MARQAKLSATGKHVKCTQASSSVDLRNAKGQIVATYAGLRVSDTNGKSVPATMRATPSGASIDIDIDDAGASYPLTVDPTWSQISELTASDGSANDQFSYSVAVSGTTAIVGDPGHTVGSNAAQGAAYVFSLSGGVWTQTAELTASDGAADDEFGISAAISGTTAVVGAIGHEVSGHTYQGAAYVFSLSGGTGTQTGELISSDGASGDWFGWAVAVSGATAVVGAPNHTVGGHTTQGAAYVFTLSGTQTAELTASDGAASDLFGQAVAVSGSTVVVGAPLHKVGSNTDQGASYDFTLSGGGWAQASEFIASDGGTVDFFGSAVALSGSTAVVSAPTPGSVYIFSLSGGLWTQTDELADFGETFGSSLALSGTSLVVGENGQFVYPNYDQGAAYVFNSSGGSWTDSAELIASDGASYDDFATSVAVSGANVFVGNPDHDVSGNGNEGAAYVFSTSMTIAPLTGTAAATDLAAVHSPSCQHSITPTDPVDCASGDFYHTFTDASIPGYGPALDLTRTYNSLNASTEGIFGYGWTSSYESHLTFNEDGSITVTEADGSQVTATADGSTFTVPSWADSTLVEDEDGSYTFVRQGTETFTYNSSGQLTSIADSDGATTTLAYSSGSCTP